MRFRLQHFHTKPSNRTVTTFTIPPHPLSRAATALQARPSHPAAVAVTVALFIAACVGMAWVPSAWAQTNANSRQAAAVQQAIDDYQETGTARVIEDGETMIVPYGKVHPVLKTALLRMTLIELAKNEYVVNTFIGDSLRWNVDFGVTGQEGNFHQIVTVKPRDQNITTSLVLTTNYGRIYHLTLDSEPYAIEDTQNPINIPYTRHVKFYYPDDNAALAPRPTQMIPGSQGWGVMNAMDTTGDKGEFIDLSDLNTEYEVDADPQFPCVPAFVGDDGVRMIIRFPSSVNNPLCDRRFPLWAVDEHGENELINYEVFGGDTYVTERIPVQVVMQYMTSEKRVREVRITNTQMKDELRDRHSLLGHLRGGLYLGAGGGLAIPTSSGLFRETYGNGYTFQGRLGYELSRQFSIELDIGYTSLPADGGAIASNASTLATLQFAPALESALEDLQGAPLNSSVGVRAQVEGGNISDLTFTVGTRYLLSTTRSGRPYVGMRGGVQVRSVDALQFDLEPTLTPLESRDLSFLRNELNILINDLRNSPGGNTRDLFATPIDEENQIPDWFFDGSQQNVHVGVGFTLGLLQEIGARTDLFFEGTYMFTLSNLEYTAHSPLQLGLLIDL